MHGSKGVQWPICTVDPSGSPVVTWCIGVPVDQRRHNTNTQLFSISLLGSQLSHLHQSPGRISLSPSESLRWLPLLLVPRVSESVSEWLSQCDRRRSPWQRLRFTLGSTEALIHNHQGGFQKISNSNTWRTDVDEGEASGDSRPLKELEIWPNYGERDDRMFTFKSR